MAAVSYTRDQLLAACQNEVTPPRAVRKTIFSLHLWVPQRQREHRQRKQLRWRSQSAGPVPCSPRRTKLPLTSISFGLLNAQSVNSKSTSVVSAITENDIDAFLVVETWHSTSDDVALRRCIPPGYSCFDVPRQPASDAVSRRSSAAVNHGGVAAIISERVSARVIKLPVTVKTFESVCFSITGAGSTVVVLLIYRPGSAPVTSQFFTELESVLEVVALYKCQVAVAGDFNIRVDRDNDRNASTLQDVLNSFDCVQHVPCEPTHRAGGTLDLVITKSEQTVDNLVIDPPGALSDHSLIRWTLPLSRQPPITVTREVRGWRKLDKDKFRSALLESKLCDPTLQPESAEELFHVYTEVLRSLVDEFAPVRKVRNHRQLFAAWMDSECRQLRRHSRRLERRFRRTGCAEDRLAWVQHERKRHQVYRQKERAYWNAELIDHARQPKKLWKTLSSVLGSGKSTQSTIIIIRINERHQEPSFGSSFPRLLYQQGRNGT
jgi:hypothetical protein